jgi:hypothetical protein
MHVIFTSSDSFFARVGGGQGKESERRKDAWVGPRMDWRVRCGSSQQRLLSHSMCSLLMFKFYLSSSERGSCLVGISSTIFQTRSIKIKGISISLK